MKTRNFAPVRNPVL